jgi:creatinine amidohydrolase/Fe(II)-dependent formamide hydrolase-like protein
MNNYMRLFLLFCLLFTVNTVSAQKTVKDLQYPYLQNYAWIRLAEIVPEITDRIILPIGTLEAHGPVAIGSDNLIPVHLADMIWEKCNALIAPAVNYGFTGLSVATFPGSVTIREDIFEEYMYDILSGLVQAGFQNILIIDGHGGNAQASRNAMTRVHLETHAHFMIVEWWEIGFDITNEVYGAKAQQPGHGDLEEAALNISNDPGLVDKEIYERLGKDNIGRAGADPGFGMMPAWATQRLPEEGMGYLNFDVEKAEEYTQKKADLIADTFLEAIRRWQMMDSWK